MPGNESIGLKYQPIYDLSGGMVTNFNFARVAKNQTKKILNGNLTKEGSIETRGGRNKLNPIALPGNPTVTSLNILGQSTSGDLIFAGTNDGNLYEVSTGTNILIKTGLATNQYLSSTPLDNYLFFCNGVDKPFMTQGAMATTYDVGIVPVSNVQFAGLSVAAIAGGDGTDGTHNVTFRYRSSITGARSNPFILNEDIQSTPVTLGAGNNTYEITIGAAAVSADPQVDFIDIFVQLANVTDPDAPYYFLGTVPNVVGVNTFGTDVSDALLGLGETIDIDDNQPPVTLRDIETWRGRILGIADDYHVRYSKSRFDANSFVNLPTSWPETNSLEVGFGDGDPLMKVIVFNDYVFAFKRRSIWILLGDFDSPGFQFKRLKTNYANVGLLNQRCVVEASDRIFFVTDDLKFFWFSMTDFSTQELRLKDPPPSDPVGDIFTSFTSTFRQNVNLSTFNFSQFTQIWVNFSDGSSGLTASQNFNTFVYDYTTNNGQGGWHIHSGIEAASSVLARDNERNYYVFTGDYYGFVWKHNLTFGDGAEINGTSTGGNYNELTLGGIVGVFLVGETVQGQTSSSTGVVTFVGAGFIRVNSTSGPFQTTEVIMGLTSGATGTLTSIFGVLKDTTKNFSVQDTFNHGVVIGGPFLPGETIEGQTSLSTAVIFSVGVGFVVVNSVDSPFIVGETILGLTSGASATLLSIDFSPELIGVFTSILSGTGADQIRRITAIVDDETLGFAGGWGIVPDNTSAYTVGGIDFEVWSRDDWLDDSAPPDFDKLVWFLDLDINSAGVSDPGTVGVITIELFIVKNRQSSLSVAVTKELSFMGALWGFGIWGFDVWGGSTIQYIQAGFNLLCKQISHRIVNRLAGQALRINGWSYCYQQLEKVRK